MVVVFIIIIFFKEEKSVFLSLPMQLGKFRMLQFSGEEDDQRIRMENNFRPPQPLKGRKVRSSN